MFDAEAYLRRLDLDVDVGPPSYDLLAALQLAHLVHVPFENLHVFHRRGVRTDLAWSYPKIVEQRRGGWCFELNGCFGALLATLGFRVDLVACDVWDAERADWGPPFDHLALVVHLDGARFLVDVGFGDSCVRPLLIEAGEREAIPRRTRIDLAADHCTITDLTPQEPGGEMWEPQLRVTFVPRRLAEFDDRSELLQTAPGQIWTEKPFATRALDGSGSRITLRRAVLRRRIGTGPYEQTDVPDDPAVWQALLLEHFALDDTATT